MTPLRLGLARFPVWAILAAAGSGNALAQARLAMPFTCDARGGEVALFRAPEEQTYRIHGAREQQIFRYCPAHTPDRCRNWMLFRFDLDCNGVKVPWVKVAEASVPDGRAWVEDGHMSLEIPHLPHVREAYSPRRRWWLERRRARFGGADGGPFGAYGDVVEFPPGFAPLLGTRARFEGTPAAHGDQAPADLSHMEAVAPPSAATSVPLPVKRTGAPLHGLETRAAGALTQADVPPGATPTPSPVPLPVKRDATAAAAAKPPTKVGAPAAAPPAPEPRGTSASPTILNRPGATPPVAAEIPGPPHAEPPPQASDPEPTPAAAEHVPPPPPTDVPTPEPEIAAAPPPPQPEPPVTTAAAPASEQEPIATGSLQDDPSGGLYRPTAAMIGLALGVILASSLLVWSRRQERARVAGLARRDVADVVLESGTAVAPSPAPDAGVPELATKLALAIGPPPAEIVEPTKFTAPEESLPMPRSRAEAFEVLGASPSAAPEVVKKIVDALRQSWHPDRATSDADRHLRELKVKQINVAWDIISGRTGRARRAARETQA